jgi:hypothetical protein
MSFMRLMLLLALSIGYVNLLEACCMYDPEKGSYECKVHGPYRPGHAAESKKVTTNNATLVQELVIANIATGKIDTSTALEKLTHDGNANYQGGNQLAIAATTDDWNQIMNLIYQIDQPQAQVILAELEESSFIPLAASAQLAAENANNGPVLPKRTSF